MTASSKQPEGRDESESEPLGESRHHWLLWLSLLPVTATIISLSAPRCKRVGGAKWHVGRPLITAVIREIAISPSTHNARTHTHNSNSNYFWAAWSVWWWCLFRFFFFINAMRWRQNVVQSVKKELARHTVTRLKIRLEKQTAYYK